MYQINSEQLVNLVFATLAGAAIGLEREHGQGHKNEKNFGGIRTFPLASILGFIGSYFFSRSYYYFPAIIFIGITLLLLVSHYKDKHSLGITSELAFILTFFIGFLCAINEVFIAVFLTVLTIAILSAKSFTHGLVQKIQENEINNAIKFAVISILILPLLPQKIAFGENIEKLLAFLPLEIINPREIWLIVVLVTGIGFFGYLLSRLFGKKKGILLTAISGGLISSTAVTMNYARESENSHNQKLLAVGILAACSIMYPRILVESFVFHSALSLALLWPFVAAMIAGLTYALYLLLKKSPQVSTEGASLELGSPLSLKDGVIFGLLYLGSGTNTSAMSVFTVLDFLPASPM